MSIRTSQIEKENVKLKESRAIKSAELLGLSRALGFYDKDVQNPDHMAKYFLSFKANILFWVFRVIRKISYDTLERSYPGFYWYSQVRTKHIDAVLKESIAAGLEQFVILGAGFDSRAYRFKDKLKGVRIFEVDFPGTLLCKKQRLTKLYKFLPDYVTYVPIDFNSQSIKDVLFESGYDPNKKTFFIWEGVSYYLPEESVDSVLEFIATNSAYDSSVVFDYVIGSFIKGDYSTYGSQKLAESWEKIEEPGLSGIEDGTTDTFLKERGFNIISDLGPEDLERIYATNKDGKQLGHIFGCMRIAYASVNEYNTK
jgi:methyltransferase (TIGR00027 family)